MAESPKKSGQDEVIKYLRANLLIQLRKLAGNGDEDIKPEVLLNQAGFSNQEIADLLGKSHNAVKLIVFRSKKNDKDKKV